MRLKDIFKKRDILKKLRKTNVGESGKGTSSAPPLQHRDPRDSTEGSFSQTEQYVAACPPTADAQKTSSSATVEAQEPRPPVTQDTSETSSSTAQAQVLPAQPTTDTPTRGAGTEPGAKTPQPVADPVQRTALSISQRLWNDAYDRLKEDGDTAELVEAYAMTLSKVVREGASTSDATDDLTELNDAETRQSYMKTLVQEGQKRISKASKITKGVGDFATFVLSAKGIVDLVVQNFPQAALPWAGVCAGLQILMNPANATKSNLAGIAHVVSRMDWYCALTEHLFDRDKTTIGDVSFESVLQQLEETVVTLYKALLLYQMKSVRSYHRNSGLLILRGLANLDDWDGDLSGVTEAESSLERLSFQYHREYEKSSLYQLVVQGKEAQTLLGDIRKDIRELIAQQQTIEEKSENRECLRALVAVDPQSDMGTIESKKDDLLYDAYKWILNSQEYAAFTNWSKGESNVSPCRLLWIKGPAGTGKTMVMIGIIRELSGQPSVLAPGLSYFFYQGTGDKGLRSATAALRSLIWLLLYQQPHLIFHLRSKYENIGTSLFHDRNAFFALSEVFKSMLRDPRLQPAYLVVDALDECDQGLPEFVKLISCSIALSDKVRWLVSSRPEVELENPDTVGSLVELDAQKLKDPVNAYIDHKLSTLRELPGYDEDTLAGVTNEIHRRAGNTFLWAALVLKELHSVEGWYAVDIIRTMPLGLSDLYEHMMTRIERGKLKDPDYCRSVLAVASLAYRPLSLSELVVLADLPQKMTPTIVKKCGSFLTLKDNTVYLIHQSAKEYLGRNFGRISPSGPLVAHHAVFSRSLETMSKTLRRDMYDLSAPGFPIEKVQQPASDPLAVARYSCVYWVDHLCDSGPSEDDLQDGGTVDSFLRKKYIFWLEALSLLRCMSEGVLAVAKLKNLQAYASALVFSPTRSMIRELFKVEEPNWLIKKPVMEADWNACLQTLEGHHGYVRSVAFSADGNYIASASDDETVKIWGTTSGACIQTLEGHHSSVRSVAFSADGNYIASASYDKTVKVWETTSGACIQTLEGYNDSVTSVAFSADGNYLASVSNDKTVKIWDTMSGAYRQTILEGYNDSVRSVAFSADGKYVASALKDKTVKIWDITSGACCQTLQGHSSLVRLVAFSADNNYIASVSGENTIKIWDITSGACRQTLQIHYSWVRLVTFSTDGNYIASVSNDKTVKIWDITSGACRQILEGHNDWVRSVAFSADGNYLTSASEDTTVKIWDITFGACRQTLQGHSNWVSSVAFSADGNSIASASGDKTVKIWDTTSGTCRHTLQGHSDTVSSVAFSVQGTDIASASHDKTIKIWDATSGACRHTIKIGQQSLDLRAITPEAVYVAAAFSAPVGGEGLQDRKRHGYGLNPDRSWITYNGQNVLWLPPEYRAWKSGVSGRISGGS
ncbi:wd-repeat protein [Ophiostoma piceae UAMH 11346]|uniref:Mitochondrial division protein 1 n=1 Tax=Ophiostoma piceae (strain UAMH 11346) TaxID=1262450 RepID=S3C443_OPHP1|nr:wd-repeat protein [Ophiostoma piceae UAMH 11346]